MMMINDFRMGREIGMKGKFDPFNDDHHRYCVMIEEPSQPSKPLQRGGSGLNYIEHKISKFDTLAGVAIKYGVEVSDIKRMNGLVTDHQMFALKTLHIPLPGRHPPSPILANGLDDPGPCSSGQTTHSPRQPNFFNSFQSLKLKATPLRETYPSRNGLQDYYGHKASEDKNLSEGFEMAVYRKGGAHYPADTPFSKFSPPSKPPRRSKSVAHDLSDGDMTEKETRDNDSNIWVDKLIRRQKSTEYLNTRTPEKLLKEDNSNGGAFSVLAGKGLALRPTATIRTVSGADSEASQLNAVPIGSGDSSAADSFSVRKSSSTSNLRDAENSKLSTIWPTSNWSLKPDLKALSTAVITRPIFNGLAKPITSRRSKAALD